MLISTIAFAQKKQATHIKQVPSRGHYSQLQTLNSTPNREHDQLDELKFPKDPRAEEKLKQLTPYYLSNKSLNDFKLPDPPANSSAQTRAELNYLLHLQNQRTKNQIDNALFMAGIYYNPRITPHDSLYEYYQQNLFHIGRSIGTWFNPKSLPVTTKLMANVWRDASYFIWSYKYKFLRIRPYKLEPALKNLEETDWAAYPSGHAANSYINAYIYCALAPEFTDVFLKDAYDMAHSREILGVHYPSDSETSRILAQQFVQALFENEKFIQEFELVKAEWRDYAKESLQKPTLISHDKTQSASCTKTCN